MTQPVPEERNDAEDLEPGDTLPGEHRSELPGEAGATEAAAVQQHHNAETSQEQPSQ
ncbi:MAG: hypothetical protein LH468_05255 [Nocardioides sp.]|nr:hypothetical protein [Nocardioides sp.]